MDSHPLNDDAARTLRKLWFDYLDHLEPYRPDLYRYAKRLTGDVFGAEDLVQDALLRGFGAIGRGDLHGDASRVRDARAYLFRTVSNLWIDIVRRQRVARETPTSQLTTADATNALEAAEAAGVRLFALTSPQERAAIVLKEVFDYTAHEIAELLDTTVGAVKSALHRGRTKLELHRLQSPPRHDVPSSALLSRFLAAFNARDPVALTACLLETVSIEVQGVGGGRGHEGVWVESSLRYAVGRVEAQEVDGCPVVLHLHEEDGSVVLDYVTRLEMAADLVARIRSYSYCPDLIAEVATQCGMRAAPATYHQGADTLTRMIRTTGLPWRDA